MLPLFFMFKCLICNKEIKSLSALPCHTKKIHNLTSREYYNRFLKKQDEDNCKNCGKPTEFLDMRRGYREFCCCKCAGASQKTLEKRKQTCEQKYGIPFATKSNIVKEKSKRTCLERYGVEFGLQNDEIKERLKKTNLKKYGVDNQFKRKDFLKIVRETSIKKYGVEHPTKANVVKQRLRNSKLGNQNFKVSHLLSSLNLEPLEEYQGCQTLLKVKCKKCNTIFKTMFFWLQQNCGGRCPSCYPKNQGTSADEKDLQNFLLSKEQNNNLILNTKTIINPLELDIFIPEKKIAIEYNGIYWHSEAAGKDKNYHLNKLNLCLEKDITLIQIFEDEWIFYQDIVKHRLEQILGMNDSQRIHARKCCIKIIPNKIKNEFLNTYHLQGSDNSPVSLGAFFNDACSKEQLLIAVMTFNHGSLAKGIKNKDENIWELNRFCSNYNYHIPGIASKLLCYFKKNYEWEKIFSFADQRWSTGNLYKVLGFELESITKPNYWYVKGLKRIHRFNLRKKPDEPKDIPEWLLRTQQGYTRVWDCGNLKFVMERKGKEIK